MNKKLIFFLIIVFVLTLGGCACKTITDREASQRMQPITLNYWRVFDGPDDFREIIDKYKALHPNITINYRKLRFEEYEMEILHALAEDRGPDIFSIHNTWLGKYQNKLASLPPKTTMVYLVDVGTIRSEIVPQVRDNPSPTINQIRNIFLDVVAKDVVIDNKIYGLPLSVDTLAMYYNRDLFNRAGITEAPIYWDRAFQENIRNLTRQDANQNIAQAGVAMGGADNIERATDILAILMMQNGAKMITDNQVTFQRALADSNRNPGLEALRFYVDFASINKEVYSWNESLPNSLEMFAQGNLAIMFGYSYHLPLIKALSPRLNFSIASLPQIEGSKGTPFEINFANYWVEVVSHKSDHINEAWDFIKFASQSEQVESYLENTNKPTALRSLVNQQSEENEEIRVFINQLLTSESWYRGRNPEAAEQAIKTMIKEAILGDRELIEIINAGASRVNQTIR